MSTPKLPDPAKLVISLFMKDKGSLDFAARKLESKFGKIDMASSWFDFDYTSYYEKEMDGPLFRRILSFEQLIEQEDLAKIKIFTNSIEQKTAIQGKRVINIDPGYMLLSRFILATGKDFSHRIYIGCGIYADLTLIYNKDGFQTLPWTYPDYAHPLFCEYLETVRNKYRIVFKKYKGLGFTKK